MQGKLKGKLVLYDPNLLSRPVVNVFKPVYEGQEIVSSDVIYGTYESALER